MKNVIEALDKYRGGEIKLDELAEAHVQSGKFPQFKHYLSDSTKRGEDPSHSIMQEKALAQFIKKLKNNEFEEAEKVAFQ
jgi:hypothetical protein